MLKIRSKLASILRPWMQSEPDLELKLGFLSSHGSAQNLVFDVSALDGLIDESTCLSFKEVRVEKLSFRASPWSATAFTVEVQGVYVALAAREPTDERRSRCSNEWSEKEKKEILSVIDPEGIALHDLLERMSIVPPKRNWLMTSLLNVVLKHSQLQVRDIHIELKIPARNDSIACFLKMSDFSLKTLRHDNKCLLSGLLSTLFVYQNIYYHLLLNTSCLELGFEREECLSRIVSSFDLFGCFKYKDLQLLNLDVHVPQLDFTFSPMDLPVILAFYTQLTKKVKTVRNGRELWSIAARKIGSMIRNPKISFRKLVDSLGLWLHHVRTYESLLLLVGYPTETTFGKSSVMMSLDNKYSAQVKNHWKSICEIEKDIPVDVLARTRRIARRRAAMHGQRTKSGYSELQLKVYEKLFWKLLLFLSFFLKSIFFLFKLIIHFLSLVIANKNVEPYGLMEDTSGCSRSHHGFAFRKITITISPTSSFPGFVNGWSETPINFCPFTLLSFCIVLDCVFLVYVVGNGGHTLSFSCGDLNVKPSTSHESLTVPPSEKNWKKESNGSFKRRGKEGWNDKKVLWFDPAAKSLDAEKVAIDSSSPIGNAFFSRLERHLEEIWSDWKTQSEKFASFEAQYLENPILLCEIRSVIMDPFLVNDCGNWKFVLSMGKLNIDLGYSSIISVSLLLWQIRYALSSCKKSVVVSHSPSINVVKEISLDDCFKSYISSMKMSMYNKIPEKKIQMGVRVGGARVQVSLQEEELPITNGQGLNHIFNQGHGDLDIMLNLESTELVVWPSSKPSCESIQEQRLDDVDAENVRQKRSQSHKTSGAGMSESYISSGNIIHNSCLIMNGLKTYWKNLEGKQFQIVGLKSAFLQSSFSREYAYSLMTNITTLSSSLCGMATGVTVSSYVDELCLLFQAVSCMQSATLYTFKSINPMSRLYFHEEEQVAIVKGGNLILKSTLFRIDISFDFSSLIAIMDSSRRCRATENLNTFDGASSNFLSTLVATEHGVGVAVRKQQAHVSFKDECATLNINISEIHSVIFRYHSLDGEGGNELDLNKLFNQSPYCLYELSVSDCSFDLSAKPSEDATSSGRVNTAIASTSGSDTYNTMQPTSAILVDIPDVQPCTPNKDFIQNEKKSSDHLPLSSTYQFLMDVIIGEIYVVEHSLKNILLEAHEPEKLHSSLSVDGGLKTVSWTIQGGIVFVDMAAFATFICCFRAYFLSITNFSNFLSLRGKSSGRPSIALESGEEVGEPSSHSGKRFAPGSISLPVQETYNLIPASKWKVPEACMIKLSQSLVLIVADKPGEVQGLELKADLHFRLELMNLRRRILFDLCHLTIISRCHYYNFEEQITVEDDIPHFSSAAVNVLSSQSASVDSTLKSKQKRSIASLSCGGHTSSSTAPQQECTTGNDVSIFSHSNCGTCLLEHGTASIQIEKDVSGKEVSCLWVKNCWVGHGSISGFDLTFSLSELQMLLSLFASLSGISGGGSSVKSKQRSLRKNQEKDNSSELTVPDGAIVAMQDLHQHMYFAVEGFEDKYYLSGTIHYSLIGERALFKVKYCNRKRWGMPASCFTLESVYAKSSLGEPLRLNYCPGSGFVNISSTVDNGRSLWKKLPYKSENSTGDEDLESHIQYSKNAFYLINHRCNQAVAFVDGVPEFVKKPGNPFKFKIFGETCNIFRVAAPLSGGGTMDLTNCLHGSMDQASNQGDDLPYVHITIDKVTVTIVDELPGAIDKFPLLQACIDSIEFIAQVFPLKTRVMSKFTTVISYFDVQGNLWTEIVQPVEICMFYHSRIVHHDNSEIPERGKPVHFHFRSKKVNVLLTGLSLDVILFVVGELNLAGPYAVRSSMIFANCCKVENNSGLSLLCHFYDDQEATVAGKQSTSIFLSQTALSSKQLENSSFASLQLAAAGPFRTSAIHVSLKSVGTLAWRTRVISLQDSKTYPGPFVVVHISKKNEDGFSIKVSPLLRIHNETGFPIALRFCRPQQEESESAFISLRTGDAIDDSLAALDAINLSGGSKKALMSLCLGNFQFSFRPEIPEHLCGTGKPVSSAWSGDLKGGKAVRLSGVLDKLTYRFKNVLGVGSMKYSFNTVHCSLNVDGVYATDLYFLIQTIGRDVPVIQPDGAEHLLENRNSPIALQEQKEIFLLPTFQISNNLQSEIHVILTETHPDLCTSEGLDMGKQSTIACGATAYLYANPSIVYFTVTLTTFNSRCKPVNSGDWLKMLQKQKNDIHYLDIELDFGGGKYFAYLRLSRGERGILEAVVFAPYTLQNDSDLTFLCFAPYQKALSRTETEQYGLSLPPDLGSFLPPKSITSWFIKSNKVNLTMLEERVSVALLDLDILSGFTEICLEVRKRDGTKHILKLGISLKPCLNKMVTPSQTVLIVPRYIVSNESEETIFVRQCYLEDDTDGSIVIESKMEASLWVKTGTSERKELNTFDYLLRKHRNLTEDSLIFIQFCLNNDGWSWSGPICIASLGRFFLKFRRSLDSLGNNPNIIAEHDHRFAEIALVHAVEEGSSLVLHFHRPININFPYRIENFLHNATITYYQKDSSYLEILGSGNSVDYVWDDLNLPHQLVVQITDLNISREINIDKLHSWKPFYKVRQQRGLALDFPLEKKSGDHKTKYHSYGPELLKVGYEVYADGSTRVLRISEFPDRCKDDTVSQPCAKFQLIVPHFAIHLLETQKQDEEADTPTYSPFLILRFGNINLNSTFSDLAKYNKIETQLLIVEEKWVGAPFAALLRRNQLDYSDTNANILEVTFILLPTNSDVKQVKYASIVLQPIDLNIDEETLMRLVPFWRSSLSESNSRSKQFYFKHFEIHPIKIVASFLPGSSVSTYTSTQETLRSLLHSVIKIPAVKNMNVELNGVLVTHALLTARELFIKCVQHYSWYAMRAVYIAKGSPLLPPAFASIFDDSASSSLDIFFDPSSGLINLPGLTLGMFKFISKSINKKGFSGTKRYFGDLSKTMKTAGSNVLFAAITEISDCVIKGAEASGFNGMVNGFHQGILKLAMEPSLLRSAVMEGGPDRKIKLDSSPGVDELYIEGYLQAMLDTLYMQEYLRVKVIDDLVIIKNLPPSSSLMNEIMDRVKDFLISEALLKGELSTSARPFRHLRGEHEWKIGPTMLTLWEHLFVSFAIRMLKKQTRKFTAGLKLKGKLEAKGNSSNDDVKLNTPTPANEKGNWKLNMRSGLQKFVFSGLVAYIDGRLCRCIPNAIARRIVSGFLLSLLDDDDSK